MFTPRRDTTLTAAIVAAGCLMITACTSHDAGSPRSADQTPSPHAAASYSADEAAVRTLVHGKVDRFGWVRSTAQTILITYFPRGQRYLGGERVALTDQILVVKMHGVFDHSAPLGLGSKTSANLALSFYDATTRRSIPFSQMWDDDAPDLGVGYDGGISNRELAAQRWDLRLVGTPIVRSR